MTNGQSSEDVGLQLLTFFERLRDEGTAPAYEAWIEQLQQEGVLSEDAAALLRAGDRAAIEEQMMGSREGMPIICIFWPPGTG